MEKNRSMRIGMSVAIATLITTCLIGGTFAKYVTASEDTVSARVAGWGFEQTETFSISKLFSTTYANVSSSDSDKLIAPGCEGETSFSFAYDEQDGISAPEVAYTFTVDTTGSSCGENIQANPNIRFYLDDDTKLLTWTELLAAIKGLSGDASGTKAYQPGTLPAKFTAADDTHVVGWKWTYSAGGDAADTALGNADELEDIELKIAISAAQID